MLSRESLNLISPGDAPYNTYCVFSDSRLASINDAAFATKISEKHNKYSYHVAMYYASMSDNRLYPLSVTTNEQRPTTRTIPNVGGLIKTGLMHISKAAN